MPSASCASLANYKNSHLRRPGTLEGMPASLCMRLAFLIVMNSNQTVSSTDPTKTQWQPAATAGEPPELSSQPMVPAGGAGKARRRRSRFWLGFVLGFVLLAVASCGGLGLGLGLNRISLADIRGEGVAWTPPPVTPTAAVAEVEGAASAPVPGVSTRFAAGQIVRNLTNSRVNIRATPGYLGKGPADIIGQVQPGATVQIVGDSTLADNLAWWHIRYATPGGSADGWVAEATASGVQILGE